MTTQLLKALFGSRNDRQLKRMRHQVQRINALEPAMQACSDAALGEKTATFRAQLTQGKNIEALLPEAFAVVREASVRTLGMRHFDVQLMGGIVLHEGKIAEMCTGEGKTLAATLAAYLNALTGSVHIVTVNDYLAQRDAEWMRPIYEFLGLTVGIILSDAALPEKKTAYAADIVYGTNNEFGFDYLRDNMAFSVGDRVQSSLHYAIVDEVDSILIDEARTPLIISGVADDHADLCLRIDAMIPRLSLQEKEGGNGDYTLDEKSKQVHLTEAGHQHVEQWFVEMGLLEEGASLYDIAHISLLHHLNAAMRAHFLYKRDVDYLLRDGEVVIVDEHTGRTMEGRRWSDGLHQAVEAREKVAIKNENQTLASVTFQNYFRLYNKLAGMTGTADTESYEFQQIYGLEVVVIPTNKPLMRVDRSDQIYLSTRSKFKAIVQDIKSKHAQGQPILVGTASIEHSEYLSNWLRKEGISHEILNAKQHAREALIIAQAGMPGAVTIATNMAGRGTDIVLGGNLDAELAQLENPTEEKIATVRLAWQERHDRVLSLGGLQVIGTERHESRRIDNQLRGRSGRQGDPGASQFYLSLEDNLMRIFASERMSALMQRLGMREDEAIQHKLVTRAVENAQHRVEAYHFDVRKQLLQYDDVANDQRQVVYQQRYDIMTEANIFPALSNLRTEVLTAIVDRYLPERSFEEQWDVPGLTQYLQQAFHINLPIADWLEKDNLPETAVAEKVVAAVHAAYAAKEERIGTSAIRSLEKMIFLQCLDMHWKEHLSAMDYLRQGIHLRGYAQKDPIQEYKREAFLLFSQMLSAVKHDVIVTLGAIELRDEEEIERFQQYQRTQQAKENLEYQYDGVFPANEQAAAPSVTTRIESNSGLNVGASSNKTYTRRLPKVGRNEPCPCGSKRKFKQCHGRSR